MRLRGCLEGCIALTALHTLWRGFILHSKLQWDTKLGYDKTNFAGSPTVCMKKSMFFCNLSMESLSIYGFLLKISFISSSRRPKVAQYFNFFFPKVKAYYYWLESEVLVSSATYLWFLKVGSETGSWSCSKETHNNHFLLPLHHSFSLPQS